jgi:hypothetical protein
VEVGVDFEFKLECRSPGAFDRVYNRFKGHILKEWPTKIPKSRAASPDDWNPATVVLPWGIRSSG